MNICLSIPALFNHPLHLIFHCTMITGPVLKSVSRALKAKSIFGFCFNKGMLDPSKHITMNHVPHNVYIDYWPIGQYPELILQHSIAPRTYESRIYQVIAEGLKSRYVSMLSTQGIALTKDAIENERLEDLLKHVLKAGDTPKTLISFLLGKLSTAIVVRESRWSWVLEQQMRAGAGFNSMFDPDQIQTVQDFVDAYNQAIDYSVMFSHFGSSSLIPQATTAQAQHFIDETQLADGIPDLAEDRPENSYTINKLLRFIHCQ